MSTALAFKVPAEPGWRGVCVSMGDPVEGEPELRYYKITVTLIGYWGLFLHSRKVSPWSGLAGLLGGGGGPEFEAAECERMKIDKVYALSRLLITMGWVREFQGMNVPFMVDVSEKRVAVVRRYATPWVLAEFDKRWPQYRTAFSKASNKMLFFRAAEAELYSLYHADRLKGPSN